MTKRVNFTSHSDGDGPTRFPDINTDQNWVANRQAHRRLQSEPPQIGSRQRGSGSLPIANQNGTFLVQDGSPHGITSTNDRANRDAHLSHTRRLQSLPARKPGGMPHDDEGRSRVIKSAPDNNPPTYVRSNHYSNQRFGNNNRASQAINNAPPHARSRIADYDTAAELHQKTHGIATRAYEEHYLRSNKFATSWARVRADNPTFMENVPGQMVSEKRGDDSPSPSRSTHHHSLKETSPNRVDVSPYEIHKKENRQNRGRMPFRRRGVKKQKHSRSRSPHASHTVLQKENQPSPRETDEESGSDQEDANTDEDLDGAFDDLDESNVGKKSPRRQPWNDSVVVPTSTKPPPKLDARRCRHDLTFKPAVNTDQIVTKTYSGQDEIVIRDRVTFDDNLILTDDEEGYASPSNESSTRSNDNSPDRIGGKERMLTRREAKMYIKMMNVYGSDAFKNQRKEWFVKKLNEVQEAKSKFEEQEKRNLQKKRNADRLKQERQLNYVRNKFRREQLHRFQTQYVTARVLEYEKATRRQYGLPEDFEDLAYLLNDDEDIDQNGIENANMRENNAKGNSNKDAQQTNMKNKKDASQSPLKSKQKSDKRRTQKELEEEVRRKEQEQKARQKQSAWYTHGDTQTIRQESPTSYGTSGYESEKSPSEHNGNVEKQPTHVAKVNEAQIKQKADDKGKVGREEKPSEAQKRLASQKHIYEKKPEQRVQQRPILIADNAENKASRVKRKDDKGRNKIGEIQTPNAGIKLTKDHEHEKDSNSRPNQQQQEKNKLHDIAHDATASPEKSAVRNKPLEKFPNKRNGEQWNDKNMQSNRSQLPSQGTGNNKKAASQTKEYSQFGALPSKAEGSQVYENKTSENSSKPHQTKSEKIDINDDNAGNKQPTKNKQLLMSTKDSDLSEKEESGVQKPKQNQVLPAKTQSDGKSSSKNKALTNSKPGSTNPVVEDDTPINIKRIPLAGTISKENAPQTFGVTENKLENMLSDQNTQHPSKLSSVSTKEPPADASSAKTGPLESSTKENTGLSKPAVIIKLETPSTNVDKTKGLSAKSHTSNSSKKAKTKKSETLADKMFNIKAGPSWNPHAKTPKMEGIDTVVVTGKDSKGRSVKKRRDVDNVVREASNLLKVTEKDAAKTGANSILRASRAPSPAAVTLGSDFDVDEDDELDEDIFERLRKKYNIKIDSDDEDDDLR